MNNNRIAAGLITAIIIITAGILYYNFSTTNDNEVQLEVFNAAPTNSQIEQLEHILIVYITGEILYPGVYELEENSRLRDAIYIAGGATEYADLSIINLARFISDGEHIIVPAFGDPTPLDSTQGSGLVNINTAAQSELMTLPQIGQARSADIISYRERHGRFNEIYDIKNVPQISAGIFETIKDLITVR